MIHLTGPFANYIKYSEDSKLFLHIGNTMYFNRVKEEASDFFSVALGTFFIDYVLSKSNIFKFMITL